MSISTPKGPMALHLAAHWPLPHLTTAIGSAFHAVTALAGFLPGDDVYFGPPLVPCQNHCGSICVQYEIMVATVCDRRGLSGWCTLRASIAAMWAGWSRRSTRYTRR